MRSFSSRRSLYNFQRKSDRLLGNAWSGGVILVIFAVLALFLANNPYTRDAYHRILTLDVGFHVGGHSLSLPVEAWINDALMVLFFFVVGLEIRRELIAGELSGMKHAMLPVAAALGGMAVPALIFMAFNRGTAYEPGWGIPMATDIAFAIGILSLLGKRVPVSLKVFLTALAIVDDLGAIVVIAVFYSSQIDVTMLLLALGVIALLIVMNRRGVYRIRYYVVPSVLLWFFFLNSGVHATISGVLIAMLLPSRPRFTKKYFSYKVRYYLEDFKHNDREGVEVLSNERQYGDLARVWFIAGNTASLSQRLEHIFNPVSTFFILPVFALANAGVSVSSAGELMIFDTALGWGVFLGLVVGKPLGIFLLSWITVKLGWAALPERAGWSALLAVGCLGGIGFTMSIFIDNLAFSDGHAADGGKIAILMASAAASAMGAMAINLVSKRRIKDGGENK